MGEFLAKLKALLFVGKLALGAHYGLATTFSAVDPWNPDPRLYCTNRVMKDTDLVVAHPTLPCGTPVWLFNPRTLRTAVAIVQDRGPRHAMVDLSKAVARRLRSNGMEHVLMLPIKDQP